MYGLEPIADISLDVEGYLTRLASGTTISKLPMNIFFPINGESMRFSEFEDWLAGRVFPKDRKDASNVLRGIGLKEYDVFDIARVTKASSIEDDFWLMFSEMDNYYQDTIRGQAIVKGLLG